MYSLYQQLKDKDFGEMKAKDFEDLVCSILGFHGVLKRQVPVKNRGDGHKGRVDLVLETPKEKIGIEIDRKIPRKKSVFKLMQLEVDRRFLITRSPFSMKELCTPSANN